jgi:hypothetical protein
MAKKKRGTKKKKSAKGGVQAEASRTFSLVGLHGKLQDAIDRLSGQPQTTAAKRLMAKLVGAQDDLDCGQTMSPPI